MLIPALERQPEKMLYMVKEYLCLLGYSACLPDEQLHSLSTTLAKVTQNCGTGRVVQTAARFTPSSGIRNKISRWLADPFVREVLHYDWSNVRTDGI